MHGYILKFPKESTCNVPEWLIEGKWPVHSQFTRSCDRDVLFRKTMGTPWIFPKKVPLMFLSGSFEMTFVMFRVVRSQCSQSVKFKMNQNGAPKMFPSGTFRMSWHFYPWCTTFGKFLGHFGDTARKCLGNWKTGNILNEPNIYPKCPGNFPKVVHCG